MTAIINKFGQLVSVIVASDDIIALNTPKDCFAINDEPSNSTMYYDFELEAWIEPPSKPTDFHIFDYELKSWVDPRSLDEIKSQKWVDIKAQRDQLEFGGFEFEGNVYDSDQVSQGRIMGAASAGVDQIWTLADNTTVSLTASQLRQLYAALQVHIASVHERGRIARQLIFEAETNEEVEAVTL